MTRDEVAALLADAILLAGKRLPRRGMAAEEVAMHMASCVLAELEARGLLVAVGGEEKVND